MKRPGIICAVVLLMLTFSLWHYELYADHCNTEQPPQEQPPAEEAPPTDTPSEPSGPTAPRVAVDETNSKDTRIPEIPPYVPKGGPFINEDGSVDKPPKSDPMVSNKVMDKIRKSSRVVTVDHVGDGTITVLQSHEDCCNLAEKELQSCYTKESREVYYQCMKEKGLGDGHAASYADGLLGWSDAVSIVCEGKQWEFQLQCIDRFSGKCLPKGCKIPQWVIVHQNRKLIEMLHGPGSTGGGAHIKGDPEPIPAGEMPH